MRPCRRCFVPQAQQRVTAAPSYTPVIHAGPGTGRLLARSLTATAAIAETRLVSYSKPSRRHLERNRDCNTWLAETHSDRIVRTRLHNSATDWARDSRDSSYLYSGSLLDAAAATAARIGADPARYPPLSQSERDFLRASQSAHRRRVRRRQGIIAVLMALVVGFAAVAVIAVRNGQTAVSELDAAVSAKLVAESQALGDNNPVLAKLETVAAWRINPSDQARHAMLAAARLPGGVILASGTVPVDADAYRPDGKILT